MNSAEEQAIHERVRAFERRIRRKETRRLGEGAAPHVARLTVELAYHAALPVAINAEIVHLLRVNFFANPPYQLPFSAEADLLLSDLCYEVGEGTYEMEPDVRTVLLQELVRNPTYGNERLRQVAALLWDYTERRAPWSDRPRLERAQRLTALNFLDPARAKAWMEQAEAGAGRLARGERDWLVAMQRELEQVEPVQQVVEALKQSVEPIRRQVAVVVGVSKFQASNLRPLHFPAGDAVALSDLLAGQFGFDPVYLLTDEAATGEAILKTVAASLENAGPDTRWLFFFAGMAVGDYLESLPGELVPYDASADRSIHGMRLEKIYQPVHDSSCGEALIILNANYYGDLFSDRDDPQRQTGRVLQLLTARVPSGYVYDMGRELSFFTQALIDGLSGRAAEVDGTVRFSGLLHYVHRIVPERFREARHYDSQEPYGANLLPSLSGREFTFHPIFWPLSEQAKSVLIRFIDQAGAFVLPDEKALPDMLAAALSAGRLSPRVGAAFGRVFRRWASPEQLPVNVFIQFIDLREALLESFQMRASQYELSRFLIGKTTGFTGRAFLFDAINRFRASAPSGYFLITGEPGIGKTAFLAEFVRRTGCVAYFQLPEADAFNPEQFLNYICAQLIVEYGLPFPALPPAAERDAALLFGLLARARAKLPQGEALFVVLDELYDLLRQHPEEQARFLPRALPDGVYCILASRPGINLIPNVENLYRFDFAQAAAENMQDAAAYIQAAGKLDLESIRGLVVEASQGNFMYLRYMLQKAATIDSLLGEIKESSLSDELRSYYEDHWKRMGMARNPSQLRSMIVFVLVQAQKPLSLEELLRMTQRFIENVRRWSVQEILGSLSPFLKPSGSDHEQSYALYHPSFREYLRHKRFPKLGAEDIADIKDALTGSTFYLSSQKFDLISQLSRFQANIEEQIDFWEHLSPGGLTLNEAASLEKYQESVQTWQEELERSFYKSSTQSNVLFNTTKSLMEALAALKNVYSAKMDVYNQSSAEKSRAPKVHYGFPDASLEQPVDFLIITAFAEARDAILARLPKYQKLPQAEDDIYTYFQASLPVTDPNDNTSTCQVIVIGPPENERIHAAGSAILRWRPSYIVFVGIAMGIPENDVRVGDILIANQMIGYDPLKLAHGVLQFYWEEQPALPRLLESINNFGDDNWFASIKAKRPEPGLPRRHIGPIALAGNLIAFSEILENYRRNWTRLIGVEMGTGGAAADLFRTLNRPGTLMIFGVSDLVDGNKGPRDMELFRTYACEAVATFTLRLLQSGVIKSSMAPGGIIGRLQSLMDLSTRLQTAIEESEPS